MEPLKDGTVYLMLIEYQRSVYSEEHGWDNGWHQETAQRWELIHWGIPVGISNPTWCNQIGLGMIFDKVIDFMNLDEVLNVFNGAH